MMQRIVDNKRIQLTDSEFQLYQEICKAYDAPKSKGSDLFRDLFETDQNGMITFLRAPNKTYTSMEVYLFIVNVFIRQHLGHACDQVNVVVKEARETISEAKQLITELKKSRDK